MSEQELQELEKIMAEASPGPFGAVTAPAVSAHVVRRYFDSQQRRCTAFVATMESATEPNAANTLLFIAAVNSLPMLIEDHRALAADRNLWKERAGSAVTDREYCDSVNAALNAQRRAESAEALLATERELRELARSLWQEAQNRLANIERALISITGIEQSSDDNLAQLEAERERATAIYAAAEQVRAVLIAGYISDRDLMAPLNALLATIDSAAQLEAEPGTPEAIMEHLFEFAERECGHNPVSARHALSTVIEYVMQQKRLEAERANHPDARLRKALEEISRLYPIELNDGWYKCPACMVHKFSEEGHWDHCPAKISRAAIDALKEIKQL